MLHVAFACAVATRAVLIVGARSVAAVRTLPSLEAGTLASDRVADAVVLAVALLTAVQSEFVAGALVEAFLSHEPGRALALARDVMAGRFAEALAVQLTVRAVRAVRASIRAHRPNPARRTLTVARLRVALAIVLAAAVLPALVPMLAIRALILA